MKQRFYFDGDRDLKRSFQSMKNLMALCGALCALSLSLQGAQAPLVISEIMAENDSGLVDENGNRVDWIEIQNVSSDIVDLENFALSDDRANSTQWSFPEQSLAPGAFLIVFASGKDRAADQDALHTNFSLSNQGEYLALIDKTEGQPIHEMTPSFPPQQSDVSFGLPADWRMGQPLVMQALREATPGKANASAVLGRLSKIRFSQKRGFQSQAFELSLELEEATARIRYTTDGSIPTEEHGNLYEGPWSIAQTTVIRARAFGDGYLPSRTVTRTYLFPSDIVRQSPDGLPPVGFPYHWGRNRVDYGMDARVVDNPAYQDEWEKALRSIPSYSLVTDMDHLFDLKTGIYANAQEDGRPWERPTSVELIHGDGSKGFQIDAGLRIRGGFSRREDNAKHAFRLFFRDSYGEAKLKYPLFGEKGAEAFDHLDLRCSSNYSWSMGGDPQAALFRDQINRDLQASLGQPAMRGYFCHLYINGHYWGLYNTCERPKAGHGAQYFGGQDKDYDVVKASKEGGIMASDGSLDAWRRVYEIAREGLEENDAYFKLQGRTPGGELDPDAEVLIDIDNLIDYNMILFYGGNLDAAITWFGGDRWHNNWYGMRHRSNRQGFQFFIWDAEHTFLMRGMNQGIEEDRTGPFPAGKQFESSNPQWLWQQCLDNAEFRIRAADRIHALYHQGGLLTPDAVHAVVQRRAQEIESAVMAESARWGDTGRGGGEPRTRDEHWRAEVDRILNEYIPRRSDIVLAQLFRQGLVPDFSPAACERRADDWHLSAERGQIFVTLDGSDPRAIGGKPSEKARVVSMPIPVKEGKKLRARVYFQGEWSVLTECSP